MKIGYARTSTVDQVAGFDVQLQELADAGCEQVFSEQVSAVEKRLQLQAALESLRTGDVLVVTKLDRLARSTQHLLQLEASIRERGAFLQVLNIGIDSSNSTGRLILTMIGAVGQFEREIMLERQRYGIAKAKAAGKYKGRKPTARALANEVKALRAQNLGATAIARQLGIGRASVYRIVDELTKT